MAGIPRKYAKIFGENTPASIAQFGSLAAGTPLLNVTDLDIIQGLAAWQGGWPMAIVGNQSPALEDFMGVHYYATKQIAYLMARGTPEWDHQTAYNTGDLAKGIGTRKLYYSKQDGNANNVLTDTNWWGDYESLFDPAGAAATAQAAAIATAAADATAKANAAQAAAIAASDPNGSAAAVQALLQPGVIKAYAYFNGGPFATPPFGCPIYHSLNCAGITCTDAGKYTFDFVTPMPGPNSYLICGNCGVPDGTDPNTDPGFNNVICNLGTRNGSSFNFGAWESRLQIFEYCSGISVFAI